MRAASTLLMSALLLLLPLDAATAWPRKVTAFADQLLDSGWIVRGRIVAGDERDYQLAVEHVFKGELPSGQTIRVVNVWGSQNDRGSRQSVAGQRILAFLSRYRGVHGTYSHGWRSDDAWIVGEKVYLWDAPGNDDSVRTERGSLVRGSAWPLETAEEAIVQLLAALRLDKVDERPREIGFRCSVEQLKGLAVGPNRLVAFELANLFPEARDAARPWLRQALGAPGCGTRREAARILGTLGPEARDLVPELIQVLRDCHREPDTSRTRSGDPAEALGNIGPDAAAAVPALLELMEERRRLAVKTSRFEGTVIEALGKMGPAAGAAVPLMMRCLEVPSLHRDAVFALGRIGPAARAALPALLDHFGRNAYERPFTARTLGQIGLDPEIGVPLLSAELYSYNKSTRLSVVEALGTMGYRALPVLLPVLADWDGHVRSRAARTLAGMREVQAGVLLGGVLLLAGLRRRARRQRLQAREKRARQAGSMRLPPGAGTTPA